MADRGDRFRHLRTPATGDLFAHFGVATAAEPPPEPAAAETGATPVIAAAACEGCGWYRALPLRGPCPLCGAPPREPGREPGREPNREAGREPVREPGREPPAPR